MVTETGDADDGSCDASCTLRDAVDSASASANDHIVFEPVLPSPIVFTLTGDALPIDTTLRITASNGVTTIQPRTSFGRVMELGSNAGLLAEGLTFRDSQMSLGVAAALTATAACWFGAVELTGAAFANGMDSPWPAA